jgi:neutral ceramidase
MTQAGFAKIEISSPAVVGAQLMGYSNRAGGATGIHDPLFVRALVLDHDGERVALCGVDLTGVSEDVVRPARERIAQVAGIAPGNVFISATHTHSGPNDDDEGCWPDGLDAKIAEAVALACERLTPAVVGAGWGMLHGYTLNRRRFEDPVDPAVLVIRVDDLKGKTLGLWYGFGCHAVVLGADNLEVSGDFAGLCSGLLEAELGGEAVAIFAQGGAADVNPLTAGVREHLDQGRKVNSKLEWLSYYGPVPAEPGTDVGDREGGTFAEAEEMARALADEVLRVHRGIEPGAVTGVWTRQMAMGQPKEPTTEHEHPLHGHATPRAPVEEPLEIMLVGIDGPGVVLAGEPGDVFSETTIRLRRELRLAGVPYGFAVGYANGRRTYLPPDHAFPDGGYEVAWAKMRGLPETLQDEIRTAVLDVMRERATAEPTERGPLQHASDD